MTGEQWNTIGVGDMLKTSTGKLLQVMMVEVDPRHGPNRLALRNGDGKLFRTRDTGMYELDTKAAPKAPEDPAAGISLRDYFAALAMQGLMASDVLAKPEHFARSSYEMADAMLAERAK